MRDDSWFAGFVDGEGSFNIAARKNTRRAGCVHYLPSLGIALRGDDAAILDECHAAFGGFICQRRELKGNQNPVTTWLVARKDHLSGLVGYFERFPLRTKKHRDYLVWRRAVEVYNTTGGYSPELAELKAQLTLVRRYSPSK